MFMYIMRLLVRALMDINRHFRQDKILYTAEFLEASCKREVEREGKEIITNDTSLGRCSASWTTS